MLIFGNNNVYVFVVLILIILIDYIVVLEIVKMFSSDERMKQTIGMLIFSFIFGFVHSW